MNNQLKTLINDIAHITIGAVVALGTVLSYQYVENIFIRSLIFFLIGIIIGLLAEAKEDNPNVFKARLSTFNTRDILGYGVGSALVSFLV